MNRDLIASAALEIIDAEGVAACSMRRLAAKLGVEAMSLYWHFPKKRDLLDGVVERVLDDADSDAGPQPDWQSAIRVNAWGIRRMLLAHPHTVGLILERSGSAFARSEGNVRDVYRQLREAGFSDDETALVIRGVIRVSFGVVMVELKSAEQDASSPVVGVMPPDLVVTDDALFSAVIDTLIAGAEGTLAKRAAS